MDKETQMKQLEVTLAAIDRQFGKGAVIRLGTDSIEAWPSISTGAPNLDLALGIGGLPKGRIVEIYGPESSGKSTLCLSVIAEAQRQGGLCAFVDVEHAVDPGYARDIGVNIDDLVFSQPDHGEQAAEILDRLLSSGLFAVIVVDSVAALTPLKELEGEMGDSHVGLQARLMGQMLRKINSKVGNSKTLVIFTNQLREKVGIMFGNPETTPGGRALKFYASVRLDLRKVKDLKDGENIYGVKTKAKVIKNKMAPPLKSVEFDIRYGKGVDTIGILVDMAEERGIVQKSGAWYAYNGENLGQGRENTIQALANDLDVLDEIRSKVLNG